jgi:hypothetical protein
VGLQRAAGSSNLFDFKFVMCLARLAIDFLKSFKPFFDGRFGSESLLFIAVSQAGGAAFQA